MVEHRLVEHHQQVPIGQRQAVVGAAAERRAPVAMHDQLRLAAVLNIDHHQAGIAPGGIRGIAVHDRMVQAVAALRRPVRLLAGGEVHARQPVAAGLARFRRVGHVDGHEDVVREAVEQRRDIGPAAAGVPDAMHAAALDRHEADLARVFRVGDVVDRHACGPVALLWCLVGGADGLAERALVVGVLVLELGGREHVLGVDHQQQAVRGLQVDVPGVRRGRDVGDGPGVARIAHVDHGKALGEHVAGDGIAALDHELHAVGTAALIAVADQAHVARVVRRGKVVRCHGGLRFLLLPVCQDFAVETRALMGRGRARLTSANRAATLPPAASAASKQTEHGEGRDERFRGP